MLIVAETIHILGKPCLTKHIVYARVVADPPPRIHPPIRFRRILEQVDPTRQPNRIRADKPSDIRIVEPEGVVVQPGFAVQVLALEAQVLLFDKEAFLLFGQGVAPDLVAGLPDATAVVFGELLR